VSSVRYANLFSRLLANSVESDVHSYEGTCCWEWTGWRQHRGGYGRCTVRVRGKPQARPAHRVMAEVVLGRPLDPDLETLEHACGITWCINFLHLKIATRGDNTADAHARRAGKPRRVFKPLIDNDLYIIDRFIRSLPTLRSSLLENQECPF
jgi:hypothetical protein